MNEAERRRRALAAFREVVDLPIDQRAAWLEQHCAHDAQLIAQVLALLAADDREGEPFDGDARIWDQALHVSEEHEAHDAMLGRQLGAWRVLDVLGRGGMGAVYRVERDDGAYTQQAALKLIRASTDSQAARERFLRERQILAALRHPHIATLLDGGISPQGEPYFVMELIDGQPIDRWCDAHNLGLRERVTLFLQVLDAVRYAHRNLVVHRDLKPSNLMVDAEGRVKLLDFGIAKQLEGGAVTATHDRALTFEYASPEQLHDAPITTATDVWQLGVVLHRLLSGSHPFGLTRDTPLASQLQHLERDPEPLTRAAAKLPPEQAQQRGGHTPASLSRALRGSLSAIVQTCLRRDPEARYATADALANDLQAWLDSRPIAAVPLRRMQRLRLWGRRNRTLAAAGVAVALALVDGTGVALWQAHEARAQARIATRESASARATLAFLSDTLAAAAPEQAMRRDVSVRELLDQARRKLDEKSLDPQVRQSVQRMLGRLYQSLGDNVSAVALLEAGTRGVIPRQREDALTLADDLVVYSDALNNLERLPETLSVAEQAVALRERFAPNDPEQQLRALAHLTLGHLQKYGVFWCRKRAESALALAKRMPAPPVDVVLDVYSDLSDIASLEGNGTGLLSASRAGLAYADANRIPPASPLRQTLTKNLINGLLAQGQVIEAERVTRQAIDVGERTGGFGSAAATVLYQALADALNKQGRYAESLQALEHSLRLSSQAGEGPRNLGIVLANLATTSLQRGDVAAALRFASEGMARIDQAQVPADDAFRRMIERVQARALVADGQLPEAGQRLNALRARALRLDGPTSEEYANVLGATLKLQRAKGDVARGVLMLAQLRAVLVQRGVPADHPDFARLLATEAAFDRLRGDTLAAERHQRAALAQLDRGANACEAAIAKARLAEDLASRDPVQASRLLLEALPILRQALVPAERNRHSAETLALRLAKPQRVARA